MALLKGNFQEVNIYTFIHVTFHHCFVPFSVLDNVPNLSYKSQRRFELKWQETGSPLAEERLVISLGRPAARGQKRTLPPASAGLTLFGASTFMLTVTREASQVWGEATASRITPSPKVTGTDHRGNGTSASCPGSMGSVRFHKQAHISHAIGTPRTRVVKIRQRDPNRSTSLSAEGQGGHLSESLLRWIRW